MEQEEYTKEQIDWSYIEFVDNQDVLDLIEKVFFLSFFHFSQRLVGIQLILSIKAANLDVMKLNVMES